MFQRVTFHPNIKNKAGGKKKKNKTGQRDALTEPEVNPRTHVSQLTLHVTPGPGDLMPSSGLERGGGGGRERENE